MDEDYIPCEICNELVALSEYDAHLTYCVTLIPISYFETEVARTEASEAAHEDDIDDISRYITSSSQISGGSIREFFNNHLNGLSRSNGASPPANGQIRLNNVYLQMTRGNASIVQVNNTFFDNVEVGLTTNQIDKVSKIVMNETKDICVICQDILSTNQRKLKCEHIFCNECILRWLDKHKKCPLCLVDLEEKYLKKNNIKTI